MSYVVLARKWRPMRFEDLVGQDHVARTLENAIKSQRVAHAFLFTGVRGVGKTTSARILAKALNCMGDPATTPPGTDPGPTISPCLRCAACQEIAAGTDMDVREIDGASYNGVDEVRKLQDSLPYRPSRDRSKIFIVDEVHMLSQSAWNAFLKTLEEPPPHVKFIFATTEVHKVPVTILSRVQRFDFKLIPAQTIASRLRYVLEQEGVRADDAAIALVAREAAGSMRDAMSLLDQVIAWGGGDLVGEQVARVLGVASRSTLVAMARSVLGGDAAAALRVVAALADQGYDVTHVARDLLSVLRDLVVAKVCSEPAELLDIPAEEAREIQELAAQSDTDDLLRLHQGFAQAFDDVVKSGQPRAALEMLLVRLARRPPLLPIDEMVARLAAMERRLGGAAAPQRSAAPPAASQQPPRASEFERAPPPAARRPRETQSASPERPTRDAAKDGDEPPAAAQSPAAPAPATAVPQDALETWRSIVERVGRERPEIAAFLAHGAPLEVSAQELVVGFEPGSVFLTEVTSDAAVLVLRRAAEACYGSTFKVRYERDSARVGGVQTLSRVENEAEERRIREALAGVRRHERVAEAVEILGARLKDVKLARR